MSGCCGIFKKGVHVLLLVSSLTFLFSLLTTPVKAQQQCVDDLYYCDSNIDQMIHKHGGYFDEDQKECVYAYDNLGSCDSLCPDDVTYCDQTRLIHKHGGYFSGDQCIYDYGPVGACPTEDLSPEPTPAPSEAPQQSCSDNLYYCDISIDTKIRKHNGRLDGNECIYDYDFSGPCTEEGPQATPTPAPAGQPGEEIIRQYPLCGGAPGLDNFPTTDTILVSELKKPDGGVTFEYSNLGNLGECSDQRGGVSGPEENKQGDQCQDDVTYCDEGQLVHKRSGRWDSNTNQCVYAFTAEGVCESKSSPTPQPTERPTPTPTEVATPTPQLTPNLPQARPPRIVSLGITPDIRGQEIDDGTQVTFNLRVESDDPNYHCRWDLHNTQQWVPQDCVVTETFKSGDFRVSVFAVNSLGLQSQEEVVYFRVKKPTTGLVGCSGVDAGQDVVNCVVNQAAGNIDPLSGQPLDKIMLCVVHAESGANSCAAGADGEIGIFQYMPGTWKGQGEAVVTDDVGNGNRGKWQSGAKWGQCWGTPGSDTPGYNRLFGVNIDASSWDPYKQISATKRMMLNKRAREWATYPGCVARR